MQTISIIVFFYAGLVLAGGVIGFIKVKSVPSLVAGIVFGGVLCATGSAIMSGHHQAILVALAAIALLFVIFLMRYLKGRVFMPGGLMAILSVLAFVAIAAMSRGL